jgi:hypothetical protein
MKTTQITAVVLGSLLRLLRRCVPDAERLPYCFGRRLRTIRNRGVFIPATAVFAFSWLIGFTHVQTAGGATCQLTLAWQDNSNNEDGFKIERADSSLGPWTQIAQLPVGQTSYQDTGVVANWVYYYRLRAYNAAGNSGYSNVASGSTPCSTTDSVGDGISDVWRQAYFGGSGLTTNNRSCATCDADGTGQNNLFKYTAGLDPTNRASIFVLKIVSVNGLPNVKQLIFNPIASGRTYTVESKTNLVSGSYVALGSFSGPQTNVNQVTVTDLNATQSSKFYRVRISRP